jgi:hypothetical protein
VVDHLDAIVRHRAGRHKIVAHRGRRHDRGGAGAQRRREPPAPTGVVVRRGRGQHRPGHIGHDQDAPLRLAGRRRQEVRRDEQIGVADEPFEGAAIASAR